jgi:hypothetical protein
MNEPSPSCVVVVATAFSVVVSMVVTIMRCFDTNDFNSFHISAVAMDRSEDVGSADEG